MLNGWYEPCTKSVRTKEQKSCYLTIFALKLIMTRSIHRLPTLPHFLTPIEVTLVPIVVCTASTGTRLVIF